MIFGDKIKWRRILIPIYVMVKSSIQKFRILNNGDTEIMIMQMCSAIWKYGYFWTKMGTTEDKAVEDQLLDDANNEAPLLQWYDGVL